LSETKKEVHYYYKPEPCTFCGRPDSVLAMAFSASKTIYFCPDHAWAGLQVEAASDGSVKCCPTICGAICDHPERPGLEYHEEAMEVLHKLIDAGLADGLASTSGIFTAKEGPYVKQ